jgi:hypothetical protein
VRAWLRAGAYCALGGVCLFLALELAVALVVVAYWETRITAMMALTAGFATAGIVALAAGRARAREGARTALLAVAVQLAHLGIRALRSLRE